MGILVTNVSYLNKTWILEASLVVLLNEYNNDSYIKLENCKSSNNATFCDIDFVTYSS